jgi:acetoacetate decarboxylase
MVTRHGTPLDAPLYQMNPQRGVEYWNCRAVAAAFTVAGDVSDLVPEGLHLPDAPPIGMVFVADYGNSTLGPYSEFVSFLQVESDDGERGMYIPYIYVTNDAAMAAGREVLGAPKKMASISITTELDVTTATLARPSSTPLATVTMVPAERLDVGMLSALMPEGAPVFSLRYLPAPPGGAEVRELVRWTNDIGVHTDAFGDPLQFIGPGSVTYPAQSAVDPVHRLAADTMLGTMYMEFDLRLHAGRVVRSTVTTAEDVDQAGRVDQAV